MLNIFNIVYDDVSFAERDTVFENIGDLSNPRPELYEYHHILKFYEESRSSWKEGEFYGFLSTNFYIKTGLEGKDLLEKIDKSFEKKKIILINPWWRLFQSKVNSLHQGEENHPGLMDCFSKVMKELQLDFEYERYFSNSQNTTYSNFFLARPEIWDEWVRIVKAILVIADDSNHHLSAALNAPAKYKNGVSPKMLIFVLERIINCLVSKKNKADIGSFDSFACSMDSVNLPPSHTREIDRLRLQQNKSDSRKYDELISLMWQQKKLEEIEKLVGVRLFKAAVTVIKAEMFSPIFGPTLEAQRIKILHLCGNYDEALARASKAVLVYRDDALCFELLMCRLLVAIEKLGAAKSTIENLLERYPKSHVLVCDYLTILLRHKDYSLCIDQTNSALTAFPRSWLVPFIASKLCLEINQAQRAQEYMLEAVRRKNSRRRIEWNMI